MIHKDGLKFVLPALIATAIAWCVSLTLALVLAFVTAYIVYFFRSPKRFLPLNNKAVVAPADGVVVDISTRIPPANFSFSKEPVTKISIFLNIFDVHVNCSPVSGKVTNIHYHSGQFLNASLDKASDKNERNCLVIEYAEKKKLAVVQIAGLIARRIRCDVEEGNELTKGEIFGLIRFGSRVDIYFDRQISHDSLLISKGQRVRMGETPIVIE